jgi:hypothetical protein
MQIVAADHASRRADHAAFEAYCYDTITIDGVEYIDFGVEARDTQVEVIRGRFIPAQRSGVRRPLAIRLVARAPELSLDRAAELIRNTLFHIFLMHNDCEDIEVLHVSDGEGGTVSLPYDRC